jgi:hypothetical protein
MSHTPGPWHLGRADLVSGADGSIVCDVQTERPYPVTKRNAADARLIAAAPELYEALQRITDHFASVMGGPLMTAADVTFASGVEGIPTIAAARAALAKVEERDSARAA